MRPSVVMLVLVLCVCVATLQKLRGLRPDFTSKLVHGLAFGTSKFYVAPYGKINNGLVNKSSNCDVKSGFRSIKTTSFNLLLTFQRQFFCRGTLLSLVPVVHVDAFVQRIIKILSLLKCNY